MTQIDWSKAPEGATHWDENPSRIGSFMKLERGSWFFWPVGETLESRWHAWNRRGTCDLTGLIPRPWNGEGLPPVGLEVEVLWSSVSKSYVTGYILAHDEGRAVFRFTSGERKGEYQADKPHFSSDYLLPNFRPIRTAEQIAAEKREGAIRKMEQASGSHVGSAITRVICERLYDAGARMPGEGGKA